MSDREQFELLVAKDWDAHDLPNFDLNPLGDYVDDEMFSAFAWFKKGLAARATPAQPVPSPSSVGAAIRALPLPEAIWAAIDTPDGVQFHPSEEQAKRFSIDGECAPYYGADQIRALLSEAAALAEQVQEQQWLPIENAPKDQRVLLWFPIFGNESHVEFGEWDAQQHNKKPNPYWSGDMERVFGVNWYREYPPTHYMLPPAAPSIAQDGLKSEG